MDMPWGDWQFWVVTALSCSGLWLIRLTFRRVGGKAGDAGCPGCTGCEAKATPPIGASLVQLGSGRSRS